MKLFEKNQVTFAIVLIVVYVVGVSAMQRISANIGIEYLAEMVFCLALSGLVVFFIRRNSLANYLGLRKSEVPAGKMLLYIPLLIIGCISLIFGVSTGTSLTSAIIHSVEMICVGFLEEIIFRGFLLRGIALQNLKRGAIIASITFGIGHIVNLLNGQNVFDTVCQIIYAVVVGFLLTFIFLRTSSIIMCVIFHILNNCVTYFSTGEVLISKLGESTAELVMLGLRLCIAAAYLFYVSRLPTRELPARNY